MDFSSVESEKASLEGQLNEKLNQINKLKQELENEKQRVVLNIDEATSSTHRTRLATDATNELSEKINTDEEYNRIKNQINIIESEMRQLMNEKDVNLLEEPCKKLTKLKDSIESHSFFTQSNESCNRSEAETQDQQTKLRIRTKPDLIDQENSQEESSNDENTSQPSDITIQLDNLELRARIVSYVSMAPLMLLVIAIMIAFYPTLAAITATGL